MENSCREKYKPSPKKWILASSYPEFLRNSALIPANAGLFHYAGNCPVRYIDPDGRKIIVDGDFENRDTILALINSLSETQYKYKENNEHELEIDNTKVNEKGSSIYSNAINNLIADGITTIQLGNTYKDENGKQIPIPKSTDGTRMPGYTYGSNYYKIMNVAITGEAGAIIPSENGFDQEASPSEALMHELACHADPRIRGVKGNAIDIENLIRGELLLKSGGVSPKPRMPNKNHGINGEFHK